MVIGSTTYLLNGSLDISTGEIRGSTKRKETPPSNQEPSRPITAKLTIPNAGGWSIDVGTSVRDEISPNSHLSLVVVLPIEMKIIRSNPSFYEFLGMNPGKLPKQYISEGPNKGFAFAKFISECGNVDVNVEVTYTDGRIAKKRRALAFQLH